MRIKSFSLILCFCLLSACASIQHKPVPESMVQAASVDHFPDTIRFWGDTEKDGTQTIFEEKFNTILQEYDDHQNDPQSSTLTFLALTGGSYNGAFGAGLLKGWSKSGTRPEFDIVTGISVGAIIAPFAFLGSEYDNELEEIFTTNSTDELLDFGFFQIIKGLFGGAAFASTEPLEQKLRKKIDAEMIQKIADEHRKGRRIFIGTTYLDVERPMIWDIGEIAASGNAYSRDLIHKIIVASVSIPGLFPPTLIDVQVGGVPYSEMHVDGGVTSTAFIYPTAMSLQSILNNNKQITSQDLYIIQNTKYKPEYQSMEENLYTISERSLWTLYKYKSISDIIRLHHLAVEEGMEYNLAFIPNTFQESPSEMFDPKYMQKLFNLAYEQAKDGYPWYHAPPPLN